MFVWIWKAKNAFYVTFIYSKILHYALWSDQKWETPRRLWGSGLYTAGVKNSTQLFSYGSPDGSISLQLLSFTPTSLMAKTAWKFNKFLSDLGCML